MFVCRSVLVTVATIVFVGCSHLHPGATDRDIEGTYDQVFQATLETLEAKQFPIKEVSREEGRIVTERRPVRAIGARRRVEKARARIEPDGGEVDVRLFLTFMDQSGTTQRRDLDRERKEADAIADKVISSSAIYDDYLDAIEERVEDLRDAD